MGNVLPSISQQKQQRQSQLQQQDLLLVDVEVDRLYNQMVMQFNNRIDHCQMQWYGVDEEKLLLKLRQKFREENPEAAVVVSSSSFYSSYNIQRFLVILLNLILLVRGIFDASAVVSAFHSPYPQRVSETFIMNLMLLLVGIWILVTGICPYSDSTAAAGASKPLCRHRRDWEYRGKKYEPSQNQVDHEYSEMKKMYEQVINRGTAAEKEVISPKLRAKFRQKHPEFFSSSADEHKQRGSGAGVVSPTPPGEQKAEEVECDPIYFYGIHVPNELLSHLVPYCDRSSIGNLSLTCRGVYQAIHHDREEVNAIPWPINKCPWRSVRPPGTGHSVHVPFFVASSDVSHFAVIRDGTHYDFRHLEIFNQFQGLIGELEWYDPDSKARMKPVFSPDGHLLLAPLTVVAGNGHWLVRGVQVVQLPLGSEKGPIIVSQHLFQGEEVNSVEFVSNDTVAVLMDSVDVNITIELWKIDRRNDDISLSFSNTIQHEAKHRTPFNPNAITLFSSFVSEAKTLLAIVPNWNTGKVNKIIIHDLTNNESTIKTLPREGTIWDLAFSKHGKLVVSCCRGVPLSDLNIFDCQVNRIEEIGDPRVICSSSHGSYGNISTFSADGTKVVVGFTHDRCRRRLVDFQKGEVLSRRFLEEASWDSAAWNSFANF